ncbi:PRP3-domain-containing protein [Choiromyces venosus 120613-1]|uniref:PRP3-domain-containing protein n=1 Tax=Choiromyces venosus 120613-1 TaxID=1336337 RepID=A0A3N4K1J7_9PEZI|nr:PRP3-domain-containing protein [Choiromyces venosus 120613-1]
MASMVPSKRPPEEDPSISSKKPKQDVDQERIQKMLAEARARAAAVAAKLNSNLRISAPSSASPTPPPTPAPAPQSAADRIAAMRARVSGAVSRSSGLAASGSPRPPVSAYSRREEPDMEEASKARGGLDVGLHPALLGDGGDAGSAKRGKGGIPPKFATTMANRRAKGKAEKKQLEIQGPSPDMTDPTKNPYFDPNLASKVVAPRRISKALAFNQKGKYIEQANALRRQAALEAMKKRIAEAARKVGIDEDMHADKAFSREPPPEIEWWDQGLTTASSYEAITPGSLLISVPDTIVTHYVQHPVLLAPPQDQLAPPMKPFPLTKKEQKKVRRQRRAEALKEKQAKVRLGLEPPPPPKIKKSNLMRVLGEEAVKDPTAVEARVNREIKERHEEHLKANEERKLSKEQRHEKLAANQEKDLARGIHVLVFRIETLANGRHRYKININAEQLALTGICILNPKFNLVIVEGGIHAITKFRKLMLNRIDWKESITAREGSKDPEGDAGAEEEGQAVDMTKNMCTLVWEGEVRQKGFKRFTTERIPSDALARERLERARMEYMWTQAKNAVAKEV